VYARNQACSGSHADPNWRRSNDRGFQATDWPHRALLRTCWLWRLNDDFPLPRATHGDLSSSTFKPVRWELLSLRTGMVWSIIIELELQPMSNWINTRYENVFTFIEEGIRSGDLAPGSKLAGERKLAEQLGISRETVRLGL